MLVVTLFPLFSECSQSTFLGRGANMGKAVYAAHRGATARGAPLCQNKSLKIVFNKAFKIFEI